MRDEPQQCPARLFPGRSRRTGAVDTDGKTEIVDLHINPSEAEPFLTSFLRDPVRLVARAGGAEA